MDMSAVIVDQLVTEANRTQIARALELSRPYISRVLKGQQEPSLGVVRGIAKELGVTTGELCDYLERVGVEVEPN